MGRPFERRSPKLIRERANHWFGADRDCQAWEPGGDEFLSPALIEALCMARTHPELFPSWFAHFLPGSRSREPATLFAPAIVSDRSDGKIAHLDGLNLSRAWCWRSIAPLLVAEDQAIALAPRTSISAQPCRISRAIIWASIGSRASRCWHCLPDQSGRHSADSTAFGCPASPGSRWHIGVLSSNASPPIAW